MTREAEYVLGTDEAEYQRLGLQHRLWSDLAHRTWRHAGIRPGMTVLDVGCGPGYGTFDLAQIVGAFGGGRVVAVDESSAFVNRLRGEAAARRLGAIEAHVCDAQRLDSLSAEPGSVDLAYARWVLCFVADPAAVVRGVARLLKRGGRFCVNDYFNYEAMTIAPKHEAFSRGIAAVGRSWRDRGGDPDIVARLPAICEREGLRVERLEVEQRVARPGDAMWQWPESFWRNYIPRLVQSGHLVQAEADRFMAAWREFSSNPHGFMLLPAVFELIVEKA